MVAILCDRNIKTNSNNAANSLVQEKANSHPIWIVFHIGCDYHILDGMLVSKRQMCITYTESVTFHTTLYLNWMHS